MINTCVICGEKLKARSNRLVAVLWHFRLLDMKQRRWSSGTKRQFGIGAAICLMSPIYNTLTNWKYRRARLTSEFCSLDDLTTAIDRKEGMTNE